MKKEILLAIIAFVFSIKTLGQDYKGGVCQRGDCTNGNGTFIYKNGDTYTGSFNEGKRDGYGEYTYKNGFIYKGLWKNDLKEDKNGEYASKTMHYTGSFENDYINGYGTLKFLSGKREGDIYTGEFVNNIREGNGEYYYSKNSNRKDFIGEFKKNKFNGSGILNFKNGEKWDGLWNDDVFLGSQIGMYKQQPVLKIEDTIIVRAINKKYQLFRQAKINGKDGNYGFLYPYGDFYFVHKTIEEDNIPLTLSNLQTGQDISFVSKNVIGFVTQESPNTYKFQEINYDKRVYDRFIQFCNYEICRMENSMNNYMIISDELVKKEKEYAELYAIIASQKAKDIVINITGDFIDFFWNKTIVQELKKGNSVRILGENIDTKTTINDYAFLLATDAIMYQHGWNEIKVGNVRFKDIKDCFAKNQNFIKVEDGNLSLGDILNAKDTYRTEQTKRIEKELETQIAAYLKQGRDIADNCIPPDLKFKSKQAYLYYALGYNTPEYGEMLGYMAASIRLSFGLGYKEKYNTFIDNCRKKKEFLEMYRDQYKDSFKRNQNNCLEYMKTINELRMDTSSPVGPQERVEVLTKMQKFVFGESQISECKALSINKLNSIE